MSCKDCVVGLFGPCAGQYCSAERAGLIEQAQTAAETHGHTLSEFAQVKGRPTWEASCTRCGRLAGICLDPPPGSPDVYGPALVEECRPAESPPFLLH